MTYKKTQIGRLAAEDGLEPWFLSRGYGGTLEGPVRVDAQGAAAYLRAQPHVNGKLGVIGFCSGGRHAFLIACKTSDFQACVDFTTNWDEVSFDAHYPSEPLSTFEPMVRKVLSRPWTPPGSP